jgi:hypothetical protein
MSSSKWATPQHTAKQVKKAGKRLVELSPDEMATDPCIDIVNNWRSSHGFPLNTVQNGIRRHARIVYQSAVISQRIKRLPSIRVKLERFEGMRLDRMQDLGGCRVILRSMAEVRRVINSYENSNVRHIVQTQSCRDYVRYPKRDGYRSIHRIYQYHSDQNTAYNGLLIEVQYRNILQHSWATAVKTYDVLNREKIKLERGDRKWRRFFALSSSVFATEERTSPVPNTPRSITDLRERTVQHYITLRVRERLSAYGTALKVVGDDHHSKTGYILLILRYADGRLSELTVHEYKRNDIQHAMSDYMKIESKASPNIDDVVLVSINNIKNLRLAYPNYFLDTNRFLDKLGTLLASPPSVVP